MVDGSLISVVLRVFQPQVAIPFLLSYPDVPPDVYVSCNELSRTSQDELNSDLQEYISILPPGELSILQISEWVRENAGDYLTPPSDTAGSTAAADKDAGTLALPHFVIL